jgi:GT2 family glycosyltransferase
MDLSIIIVNWNSAEYLKAALHSIYRDVRALKFQVIVVDSASFDGSAEMVAREFPETTYIQSAKNIGFARSNNLGFQSSTGKALLFLNPDTELIDDAVQRMLSHLNSDPKIGAVGCRVLNSDHSIQTACVQAFPTILNQLLDSAALQRIAPRARLWGAKALFGCKAQDVQVVAGSCLMVRREAFQAAGMFCSDYFMYTEDVELCYRVWKAGFRVQHLPTASIIHHGGSSSVAREESNFSTLLQRQTLFMFLRKTRGRLYANAYRAGMGLSALVRLALIVLTLPLKLARRADYPFASWKKWIHVLRWSLGMENWTGNLSIQSNNRAASAE